MRVLYFGTLIIGHISQYVKYTKNVQKEFQKKYMNASTQCSSVFWTNKLDDNNKTKIFAREWNRTRDLSHRSLTRYLWTTETTERIEGSQII